LRLEEKGTRSKEQGKEKKADSWNEMTVEGSFTL
jgi:hypothetical protein